MIATGFGAGVGAVIHAVGDVVLGKIWLEWEILNFIELVAEKLCKPLKQTLEKQAIPFVADYANPVARTGSAGVLGSSPASSARASTSVL